MNQLSTTILLASLFFLLLLPYSSYSAEAVYAKDYLVLNEEPNESSVGILGVVKESELFVIGEEREYYKVKTTRGEVGWVKKEQVTGKVFLSGKEVPKSKEEINQILSKYKGNNLALMAVQILDNGKFYVSIYNVSSQPFHVNPNDFTLINTNSESLHYTNSEGIMVDLQPETKTNGTIEFSNNYKPKKLVYSNPQTGRITRSLLGDE